MSLAYIALGSNLAQEHRDRAQTLSLAAERLQRLGNIVARSSLYETEPVGFREQGKFLNAVVVLETMLDPLALLRELLRIERDLGRDRAASVPKGPRTLDLDLLLVDDVTWSSEDLELPHPAMHERRFVLAPLAEIAGGMRPPRSQQTVSELLAGLPNQGEHSTDAVQRLHESW